jgi:MYXO-CTERM domain-containing protein
MKLLPSILFTCGLLAISAYAATIDTFNRNGVLAGSIATPSGGLWVGGAQTTNGQANVTYNAGSGDFSYQTITLTGNTIYELVVDMTATGSVAGNWLAFGFGGVLGSPSSATIGLQNNGAAFAHDGNFIAQDSGVVPNGLFKIKLTTPALLSGTATVNYFRNDTQFASGTIIASGINRVFLQNYSDTKGYYDNLTLTTTVVPETSSALLGLVGVLGLTLRRRR